MRRKQTGILSSSCWAVAPLPLGEATGSFSFTWVSELMSIKSMGRGGSVRLGFVIHCGVDSQSLSTSQGSHSISCVIISGREDWTQTRNQDDQAENIVSFFYC